MIIVIQLLIGKITLFRSNLYPELCIVLKPLKCTIDSLVLEIRYNKPLLFVLVLNLTKNACA